MKLAWKEEKYEQNDAKQMLLACCLVLEKVFDRGILSYYIINMSYQKGGFVIITKNNGQV